MSLAIELMPVGDSDGDAILVQWSEDNQYWLNLTDGGYTSVGESVIAHIEELWARRHHPQHDRFARRQRPCGGADPNL